MRIEQCKTCQFFSEMEEPAFVYPAPEKYPPVAPSDRRLCVRFPKTVFKHPLEWCGEWQVDSERTCNFKLGEEWWQICKREKDHEGPHQDGDQGPSFG